MVIFSAYQRRRVLSPPPAHTDHLLLPTQHAHYRNVLPAVLLNLSGMLRRLHRVTIQVFNDADRSFVLEVFNACLRFRKLLQVVNYKMGRL